MKILLKILYICVLSCSSILAQENSAVFVFDIQINDDQAELSNFQEIPHEKGYNNQPSFISDEEILFSSTNNNQADIRKYNLKSNSLQWIHPQTEGGEYSPQIIPESEAVAAVRLDLDGLQRLYKYDLKNNTNTLLIPNLPVAYFIFYDAETLLATVLNEDDMDLVKIDLAENSSEVLFSHAGRNLGKIPNSEWVSYTLINEAEEMDLYTYDFKTGESVFICQLPYGVQDYVWLDDSKILAASGYRLFLFDTWEESEWNYAGSAEKFGVDGITRMALSPNGKKLAVVGKKQP